MGDGLQVKAQLEAALNQIADENGEEDGDEAIQQVIVLHQNGITDAAHHAQAGLLGQSAHHQSDEQGDDGGGVHGAGACLAGVEDGGDCQHQHQQHKHHHGKGGALHQLGGIGALEAEATLEEQDTDDNADENTAENTGASAGNGNSQAERIIALLGGRENIVLVDACMTRLRVTVKDPTKVADLPAWKAEGALSLLIKGDGIQAVYGPKADVLKSDINDIL